MDKCAPDCPECGGKGEVLLLSSFVPCSRLKKTPNMQQLPARFATGGALNCRLSYTKETPFLRAIGHTWTREQKEQKEQYYAELYGRPAWSRKQVPCLFLGGSMNGHVKSIKDDAYIFKVPMERHGFFWTDTYRRTTFMYNGRTINVMLVEGESVNDHQETVRNLAALFGPAEHPELEEVVDQLRRVNRLVGCDIDVERDVGSTPESYTIKITRTLT